MKLVVDEVSKGHFHQTNEDLLDTLGSLYSTQGKRRECLEARKGFELAGRLLLCYANVCAHLLQPCTNCSLCFSYALQPLENCGLSARMNSC